MAVEVLSFGYGNHFGKRNFAAPKPRIWSFNYLPSLYVIFIAYCMISCCALDIIVLSVRLKKKISDFS